MAMRTATPWWASFASLGSAECQWVLREHPEKLTVVARLALEYIPLEVIPLLLSAEQAAGLYKILQFRQASNPSY